MPSVCLKIVVGCATLSLLSGMLLSQQPNTLESLLALAQQAQSRGDFQAAADFYKQAAIAHPEIAELRANLGLMYYQTEKDAQAIEAFRQAIRLKPELYVPNLFLGREYVKLKRFSEAISYLRRASLSRPTDIHVQLSLAEAYAGVGETRLAIGAYLHAAKIDPRDADIWYHLGLGYLEEVEADCRVLLARHKHSAYFQVLVADNFAEQHAFIQAAETYQKALASPPLPAGAHASYGFALLNRHDLTGAEREFNAELTSVPLMARLGLARLHFEQGATVEAVKEIEGIWTSAPRFLRTNAALFNAGLPQPKRAELQHAFEERSTNSYLSPELVALFRIGSADETLALPGTSFDTEAPFYAAQGKAAEPSPRGEYRQCDLLSSRLEAPPAEKLRMLAFCAYSTGDYQYTFDAAAKMALSAGTEAEGLYWETKAAQKLATEALRHASEMDASSPKVHVLLGDLYRQRKFFPDAEREYRNALSLQPEDTGALFGLSLALLADDQVDEAFRIAQASLQKSADDPELNAVMAEIFCARNDFAAAEPFLKKSLNTKPEYIPHVHALLGKVYARTGRTEQAIAELKLALADDKDGTIHYQLARLYLKVGNRNSAKQAFDVSQRLRREGLNRAAVAMQQGEDDTESQ